MNNKDIRLLRQMEESAVSMSEMADKSEYSKQQIHYRLTEKWTELVEKSAERENSGAIPSTMFWTLSSEGEEKLESVEINEDENRIETFEELSEIASEASRDAESAKNSVQEYRKKVSRLERRLTDIKDSTGFSWSELEEEGYSILTRADKEELRNDIVLFEKDVESFENSLESLKKDVEDIEYLESNVTNLENKLAQIKRRINQLNTENRELRTENEELKTELDKQRQRISDLEDELQRRKNRTLIERLSDML